MRASGENGEPWKTSVASIPLATICLCAAKMSETISPPRNEPGLASVTPLPNVTEAAEFGGVS